MNNTPFWSNRILELPPYVFAELDKIKTEMKKAGKDLVDLSIGDPDLPTPQALVEKCYEEMQKNENQKYPSYQGHPKLRQAIAGWFQQRFGVSLDPDKEVLVLIGSKEGLAHAPLAFVNPGDTVLVPDIFYPIYANVTRFAGGKVYEMALQNGDTFRPALESISDSTAKTIKAMYLNYPNNPTSEVADEEFFKRTVHFAKKNGSLIMHDNAYSEVYVGKPPLSILQVEGAKGHSIEFHSLSKSFNMTGWRIGYAVGNQHALAALAKVKTNIDSSIFTPIQLTGAYALQNSEKFVPANNEALKKRVKLVSESLRAMNISFKDPQATFYFWCKVPAGYESSAAFCKEMIAKANVVMTPGNGFGKGGEGFFRISCTSPENRLVEAMQRLKTAI